MPIAFKDLAAVNDTLEIDLPNDWAGNATFQYFAAGAGTVVLEGTLDRVEYQALKITNLTTKVDADNAIAAGLFFAEYVSFLSVRVRKTVGVLSCPIRLSLTNG